MGVNGKLEDSEIPLPCAATPTPTRRRSLLKYFAIGIPVLMIITMIVHITNPYNIWICRKYLGQLTEMIQEDEGREELRWSLIAENEHQTHTYQMKYKQQECIGKDNPRYTWLTALVNDDFIIPNLVMIHMLNKLSCYSSKIAIVGEGVSTEGRGVLKKAGFKLRTFPAMNCDNMDVYWGRKPQHSTFIGMHTRIWAFNMTEYDKIVYLDGDFFPLHSLDSLFDIVVPGKLAATYCAKPGVVDPCFNSGMIGFVPSEKLFSELMDFWRDLSYYSCVDDQRLMWYLFSSRGDWIKVPYSYNVRRERYYPMQSFHFAAGGTLPKPWRWADKPTRQEAKTIDKPLTSVEDIYSIWWKYLYQKLEEDGQWDWWHETDVYKRFKHSDPLRDYRAVDIY